MSSGFKSIHEDDSSDEERCPYCEHNKGAHYRGKCQVCGCRCMKTFKKKNIVKEINTILLNDEAEDNEIDDESFFGLHQTNF